MSKYELVKFDSPESLALSVAGDFIALKAGSSVALSGGRIAGEFFSAVTRLAHGSIQALHSFDYFWSDERCVPPEHTESNYRLAYERMLLPLDVPKARIHRIRGEVQPDEAARVAEAELRATIQAGEAGQPVLDLVLLGMGEDGHVASLFPGEPASARASSAVFRPVLGPKPPPQRITLGYATLAAARVVWVLVSGGEKKKVLAESLSAQGQTPLARVIQMRAQTRVLTAAL
jgi:6-phosphogluconolactonase